MNCTPEKNDKSEKGSAFVESVFGLSEEDIVTEKKKQSSAVTPFGIIRILILVLCGAVLVWSLRFIINSLIHYKAADNIYDNIRDDYGIEQMLASPPVPTSPDYEGCQNLSKDELDNIISTKPINVQYERVKNKIMSIKELYPNIYGWIEIPGTPIDYPIMQSSDNDYYLDHSYDDVSLYSGAIFADYRCEKNVTDNYNLVIYGHNMANKTMFGAIDRFLSEKFFEENDVIYIYTLDGMYTYRIASIYATNKYYHYIKTSFASGASFTDFAEEMIGNSIHKADGITVTENDRLLTLSTCSNRTGSGRHAVHAILESYTN